VTDDVRLRLGNAGTVEGKAAFVDAVNEFLGSVAGCRHEIINVWRDGDTLVTGLRMEILYSARSTSEYIALETELDALRICATIVPSPTPR
jgi:hypothetical protein